jgi:nucleoporin NUP42
VLTVLSFLLSFPPFYIVSYQAQAEQQLYSQALQQINNILRDLPGALRYIEAGENQHPNRHDICKMFTGCNAAAAVAAAPAFPPPLSSSQPAAQPLLTGGGGQTPFAANRPSPFQQPQPGGLNFGNNNNNNNSPGFPGAGAAAPAAPANPFSQPAQPAQANPFAAARKPVTGGAAAAGAFTNPFAPAAPQPAANPFAGAAPQPSATTTTAASPSPFSSTTTTSTTNNNFAVNAGNPAPFPSSAAPASSFAFPTSSSSSSDPSAPFVHPDVRTYVTRDARTQQLLSWKGRPVQYMPDGTPCYARRDGGWQRIHFPDGPPPPDPAATELPAEMYDERTKQAYLHLREHGTFKDGWMPLLPPRREWCRFDI